MPDRLTRIWADPRGHVWRVTVKPEDWESPDLRRRRCHVTFRQGTEWHEAPCRPVRDAMDLDDAELVALLREAEQHEVRPLRPKHPE